LKVLENDVRDATLAVGDRTILEWVVWAKNHLDVLNPLNAGANGLFEAMLVAGEERYMPDVAEQADQSSLNGLEHPRSVSSVSAHRPKFESLFVRHYLKRNLLKCQ